MDTKDTSCQNCNNLFSAAQTLAKKIRQTGSCKQDLEALELALEAFSDKHNKSDLVKIEEAYQTFSPADGISLSDHVLLGPGLGRAMKEK